MKVEASAALSWLRSLDAGPPPAIVCGASVNGLSFARSLGRRDVPVLLMDSGRPLGSQTRYARFVELPSATEAADAWMDFLIDAGRRAPQRPVLFATSDEHQLLLSENATALGDWFRMIVPDRATVRQIVDKRRQYGVAANAGIPIPDTHFPESEDEVRSVATEMSYPCILKPYQAHLGREHISDKKVLVLESADQLVSEYRQAAGDGARFMVQEIVPGGDEALFGYLALWDEEGDELAWLTKQKLRQNPPLFGDGSHQRTVDAPEVARLSRRLLSAFDYRGFVGIEYKWDRRDDTYRLMEINPRTVSGNQMAITAGVDFPWLGYRYLVDGGLDESLRPDFRANVRYVNEEWDFKAYLALRRDGQLTFGDWLRTQRESEAKALGAWDDPLPLLTVAGRFVRAGFRRATTAITGGRE